MGLEPMKTIVSMQLLESMDRNVTNFNSRITEFYMKFDNLLKLFNDEAIVQSFYQSGFLGSQQKERLFELRKYTEEYVNLLTEGPDSLMSVIKNYIRAQKDIVSMETRGYSISDSVAARRVGNSL